MYLHTVNFKGYTKDLDGNLEGLLSEEPRINLYS